MRRARQVNPSRISRRPRQGRRRGDQGNAGALRSGGVADRHQPRHQFRGQRGDKARSPPAGRHRPDRDHAAAQQGRSRAGHRLDAIELPVLIAHHGTDACRVTPPNKVEHLKKALKNAGPVKVPIYRDGSGIKGKRARPFTTTGSEASRRRSSPTSRNGSKRRRPTATPPPPRAATDFPARPTMLEASTIIQTYWPLGKFLGQVSINYYL